MLSKEEKSRIARANGAKSRGPKTPAGQAKCARAASENARRQRAVALTHECTLLPNESRELLDQIAATEFAFWQPASPSAIQLVHELIDINWRIKRLRFAQTNALIQNIESQRQRISAPELTASMVANAEIEGSGPDGEQLQLDRRINLLASCRARILRDLDRLHKRFPSAPGSQLVLKTQHFSAEFSHQGPTNAAPEPVNIVDWAQSNLDFHPDTMQEQILTATAKRILVLAPRQTGKSTAVAVRAVHELTQNPGALVLLASASRRQARQLLATTRQMARKLNLDLAAPPANCEGFTLPNGARILLMPAQEIAMHPSLIIVDEAAFAPDALFSTVSAMLKESTATLLLLSTPNGDTGYFYEQWHAPAGPWTRIQGTLKDCPRISRQAVAHAKAAMSRAAYQQEFECKFQLRHSRAGPK